MPLNANSDGSAKFHTGVSQFFAVVSSLANLPIAKPDLKSHADEPSNTDTAGVADRGSSQRELAVFRRHPIRDLSKCVDVYQSTEQTFPKDDGEDEPHVRYKVEKGVCGKNRHIQDL